MTHSFFGASALTFAFNKGEPMKLNDGYFAAIPIGGLVGGFAFYLTVCIYLCLNIFTDRLDEEHQLKLNSSLSWFLVPGPLKHSEFYVRFYKVISWLMLGILHAVFIALLLSRL